MPITRELREQLRREVLRRTYTLPAIAVVRALPLALQDPEDDGGRPDVATNASSMDDDMLEGNAPDGGDDDSDGDDGADGDLEGRALAPSTVARVQGHAAVFNTYSAPLATFWGERFVEQIAPGAFAKTIQEADVRFLVNHDPNLVLARTTNGTLALTEDNIGLAIAADLADTTAGRDLAISLERGDVTQMSFGMQVVVDDWDETAEGTPLRTVREVKLFDVSAVTYPAYESSDIGLRSRDAQVLFRSLGLGDLPADAKQAALAALLGGALTPDQLPLVRAAQDALAKAAASAAPVSQPRGRSLDVAKRRHALTAKRLGLPA